MLIALLLVTISGGADSLWSAHGGEMPMWVKTVTHIAMAWVLVAYVFVVKCLIKSYRQAEGQVGS